MLGAGFTVVGCYSAILQADQTQAQLALLACCALSSRLLPPPPPLPPLAAALQEDGYNGIQFKEVYDCWARDIRIINPDSGILIHSERSNIELNCAVWCVVFCCCFAATIPRLRLP